MESLAVLAGVSVSTVSRALGNRSGVSESTARRIRELAQTHHYQPNETAIQLRRGRTQTIAVVYASLADWYGCNVIAGAQGVLAAGGFEALLVPLTSLPSLLGGGRGVSQVDGLLLADVELAEPLMDQVLASGLTTVSVGSNPPGLASVGNDEAEVGRLATSHLLGLGHRRIGFVSGHSPTPVWAARFGQRRDAYREALLAYGVEPRPELEVTTEFSPSGGALAAARLLEGPDPPTALVCASDWCAYGVLATLHRRRLEVPNQVSVVSMDDHPLAAVLDLTTVRVEVSQLGHKAAQLLLTAMAHGAPNPLHLSIPASLVLRHSTSHR